MICKDGGLIKKPPECKQLSTVERCFCKLLLTSGWEGKILRLKYQTKRRGAEAAENRREIV